MSTSRFYNKLAKRVGSLIQLQAQEPGNHLEIARAEVRGAALVRGITQAEMGLLLQDITDAGREL